MSYYPVEVIVGGIEGGDIFVTVGNLRGEGVPPGGAANEALVKIDATNFNTKWARVAGVPDGGVKGQQIRKTSAVDGEANWQDQVIVGSRLAPPADMGVGQLLFDPSAEGSAGLVDEYGSNANGNYLKMSNGMLICWLNEANRGTILANSAYGSLYIGSYTWVYPSAEYVSSPTVTVGRVQLATGASWGTVSGANALNVSIRTFDVISRTADALWLSAIAIGRWK